MFKKGYFLYVIAVLFTVLTGMFYCISNRFFFKLKLRREATDVFLAFCGIFSFFTSSARRLQESNNRSLFTSVSIRFLNI
jgi:hypothetical protein